MRPSLALAATILASPMLMALATPAAAQVAVGITITLAPPVLPIYVQPPMPAVGYIWTPGYWAWGPGVGYYWVPGTWIMPPVVGVLWTPPYWGWSNGIYIFHAGYWGPHVGFYGGVNYGFGYGGVGYEGGRWDRGGFVYNRAVNNFGSVHVTNVYTSNVTVINSSRVSYVGGTGGLRAEPTAQERAAERERHVGLTSQQTTNINAAARNPAFAASRNNGHPAIVATSRPAQFQGAGVARAQPIAGGLQPGAPRFAPHPAGPVAGHPGAPMGPHPAGPMGPHAAEPMGVHPAGPMVPHAAGPMGVHPPNAVAAHVGPPPAARGPAAAHPQGGHGQEHREPGR
jgi:hypothetical protein